MQRYREIIDSWEKFKVACENPALSTVRKNRLKARDNFIERLEDAFPEVKQAKWNPKIFRLPQTEKPGKSMMHWMGEYYVQEESAIMPVEVLDPEPGDSVLDMAAAPGGKTTQIASKLDNEGKVVANDVSGNRMKSLHANIYRTGAACVAATNYDARNLPEDDVYDKVLLDAPCSGEGDRARRTFEPAAKEERESLSELQKQLIEKAGRLVKDGGSIVYSTCTLAPEENEEVVKHAIENTELSLKDISLDANHNRGVTSFGDKKYGEEMKKTVRVYPHHLDSGVIYIAKFRK